MAVGTDVASSPTRRSSDLTGASGTLTRTTSVTLAISPAPVPDFSLSATPASQTIVQGAGTTYTVSRSEERRVGKEGIFRGSGLPGGATASFSANPATASSTMTAVPGAATPT